MRQLFLFIASLTLIVSCRSGQVSQDGITVSTKTIRVAESMSSSCFNYLTTKDTIQGTVLLHFCASGLCGRMAFASLTILQTNRDTVRVLEMCNSCSNNKVLVKNDSVTFIPTERPPFSVGLPMIRLVNGVKEQFDINPEDCSFKTYYGYLIKMK